MPVTITIPAPLRQFAGGQSQFAVEAKTAGEALDQLTATHAALRRHLVIAGRRGLQCERIVLLAPHGAATVHHDLSFENALDAALKTGCRRFAFPW